MAEMMGPQTGLLSGPGQQPMPGEEPTPGGDEQLNVSPEEQAQYDQFVNNGLSLIYDEKTMPHIIKTLSAGDPVEGLASAVVLVVTRLQDSAEKAGRKIGPDVLMHGGKELLEDLANLAGKAKIHDYNDDELQGAMFRALDLFREMQMKQGKIDKSAVERDMNMLVEADKSGRLAKNNPGLAQYSEAVAKAKTAGAANG